MNDYFQNVVSQEVAKGQASFYLDNYQKTNVLPHVLLTAGKGIGKTHFAKEIARNLTPFEADKKPMRIINCSTIKNVKSFFNDIVLKFVVNQEATLFFDEAHNLPKDVQETMLTIMEPNTNDYNEWIWEDAVIEFDFRRVSFILATTDVQKLKDPLIDRCRRISLENYSADELEKIVLIKSPDIGFEDGVMDQIKTVFRGNARNAVSIANDINSHCAAKGDNYFGSDDWDKIQYQVGYFPLGLMSEEVKALDILYGKTKPCSLTNLASKLMQSRDVVQKNIEMFLQYHDLMEIGAGGRSITVKGRKYVDSLKAWKDARDEYLSEAEQETFESESDKPVYAEYLIEKMSYDGRV
jgi:Holliday junction resolvasome RuvABC ATP-dependent DNA helicase subunit